MGRGYAALFRKSSSGFSIRSFGSFDGTRQASRLKRSQHCFSIRSFGSFDGTT